MKLVAIFNVWSDWDILQYSVSSIRDLVDGVLIIGSTRSNFGEYFPIPDHFKNEELHIREPRFNIPAHSETDKRNYGLLLAKKQGYTHFLTIDSDEFYEPGPFLKHKERFLNEPHLQGLVCLCQTYFKSPTLTIGLDTTLVPFIHKLTPTIQHEFNRKYPFAWIDGQIRIDPTRSMNIISGVEMTDLIMHHMSYIRKDIQMKIRNSSARKNIERSTLLQDWLQASEGYYVEFYRKTLSRSQVDFGIPEFYEHNESSKSS
jgi:hypothetical protein